MYEHVFYDNDYLHHHGIKGMKWGVRRYQKKDGSLTPAGKNRYNEPSNIKTSKDDNVIISKKGENVELHQNPTSSVARFLSTIIPSLAKRQDDYKDYTIRDKNGNKVGNMSVNRDSSDSLNIVWIGIKSKAEGKGYGQSAMRTIVDEAKKQGYKNMTLEVPSNSPNARHIYEKLGFKDTGEKMLGDVNDIWGGLTKMRLDF